jgi:hypothetical protein
MEYFMPPPDPPTDSQEQYQHYQYGAGYDAVPHANVSWGHCCQFASHVLECHNIIYFPWGHQESSKPLLCVTASCCIWSTQRTRRRSLHELRRRSWSWHSKFWRLVHPDGNAGRAWWSSFSAERILSFVRDEFGHCLQKGAWCPQTV